MLLSKCSMQFIILKYHMYLYLFCILGALALAGFSLVGVWRNAFPDTFLGSL
jgi:hypothetical protein